MFIYNLENHINIRGDGIHAIFTGTFNPPHIGHTLAIKEADRQLPFLTSIIALPHNWNTKKNPPVEIGIRARWLSETFSEFLPELISKAVVCIDPLFFDNPDKFDNLCNTCKHRLYRVVGSDKHSILIRNKNDSEVLLTPREGQINSSIIRESICKGNIDCIRKMICGSVLRDILKSRYFE